jgi:DivIVA domain-containing protein
MPGVLLLLLFVVVAFALAAVFMTAKGDVLADAPPDDADVELPTGRIVSEDLRVVRFGMVLRGYRMREVDEVLDRLAEQLAERDERVADLERALAEIVEPVVDEAEVDSRAEAEAAPVPLPEAAPVPLPEAAPVPLPEPGEAQGPTSLPLSAPATRAGEAPAEAAVSAPEPAHAVEPDQAPEPDQAAEPDQAPEPDQAREPAPAAVTAAFEWPRHTEAERGAMPRVDPWPWTVEPADVAGEEPADEPPPPTEELPSAVPEVPPAASGHLEDGLDFPEIPAAESAGADATEAEEPDDERERPEA